MFQVEVKAKSNPSIRYLAVEEGNIDLENGMRCIVQVLNKEKELLYKRLLRVEGNEFVHLMTQPNTMNALRKKLLEVANCDELIEA